MRQVSCEPVAVVVGGRTELVDDDWGAVTAIIRLDQRFGAQSLLGLASFSHVEVVFFFDQVDAGQVETRARHPRGRTDWPLVGIFAQRAKARPNRLGVSRAEIVAVDGLDIYVQGLDALAGSPVLDIKPYFEEFGPRGACYQPPWATELMQNYYLG